MPRITPAIALTLGLPAHAESITIDLDGPVQVQVLRCIDRSGGAACEFLSTTDALLRCVALDAAGTPLAATLADGAGVRAVFTDLGAASIETVACEPTG